MSFARARFSPRRKVLLGMVLLAMVAMLVLRLLGVAGFNGVQPREMDWNDDGLASQAEIVQGYTRILVESRQEGARTCRRYVRMGDRSNPLRVECRVEFDGADGAPD